MMPTTLRLKDIKKAKLIANCIAHKANVETILEQSEQVLAWYKRLQPIIVILRQCYTGMKYRCTNPSSKSYHRYGGRGIKVCFESVDEFIDYVINELHADPRGLTIDRINNNGNYERGNIRFITQAENSMNRGITFYENSFVKKTD